MTKQQKSPQTSREPPPRERSAPSYIEEKEEKEEEEEEEKEESEEESEEEGLFKANTVN